MFGAKPLKRWRPGDSVGESLAAAQDQVVEEALLGARLRAS
jgi:hypothetical protein